MSNAEGQTFIAVISTAIVTGSVAVLREWLKGRKPPSSVELERASTAKTVSEVYGGMMEDLRQEREDDRKQLAALSVKYDELEKRLDAATTAARRAENRAEVA